MKNYLFLSLLFIVLILGNNSTKESTSTSSAPVASFTISGTLAVNSTITFNNHSSNATSYVWTFGDGGSSTDQNPTHTYTTAGSYTVILTATGNGGNSTATQTITIVASLSGNWSGTMTFSSNGDSYAFNMVISQQSDNSLTGSFVFSDGSGYTTLLSGSKLTGSTVLIEWMLETYEIIFNGTANSSYNYMNGTFSSQGVSMGTWYASKTSKKASAINFLGAGKSTIAAKLLNQLK